MDREDSLQCCLHVSVCMLSGLIRRDKMIPLSKIKKYRASMCRVFPTDQVGNAESLSLEHTDLVWNSGAATYWLCDLGQVP